MMDFVDFTKVNSLLHPVVSVVNEYISYFKGHQKLFASVGILTVSYVSLKAIAAVIGEAKVILFGRWLAVDLKKQGEWAVVTGASDGIGEAYCQELAERGLNIVLISRSTDKLKNVAAKIESNSGVKTKCITVDFSHGPDIYSTIKKELTGLDIGVLVNNVGIFLTPDLFLDNEDKSCLDIIAINMTAAVMMTRVVMPRMVDQQRGVILNISSNVCYNHDSAVAMYAATKVFLQRLTRTLQREYRSSGVIIQDLIKTCLPRMLIVRATEDITWHWRRQIIKQRKIE